MKPKKSEVQNILYNIFHMRAIVSDDNDRKNFDFRFLVQLRNCVCFFSFRNKMFGKWTMCIHYPDTKTLKT